MIAAVAAGFAWVLALGARYGVDPLVFAALYIGAIPLFLFFSGLAVKRLRAQRPATLPILAAGLCFVSAYLYLAAAGQGIPLWVWLLLVTLVGYGAWSALRSARRKIGR